MINEYRYNQIRQPLYHHLLSSLPHVSQHRSDTLTCYPSDVCGTVLSGLVDVQEDMLAGEPILFHESDIPNPESTNPHVAASK